MTRLSHLLSMGSSLCTFTPLPWKPNCSGSIPQWHTHAHAHTHTHAHACTLPTGTSSATGTCHCPPTAAVPTAPVHPQAQTPPTKGGSEMPPHPHPGGREMSRAGVCRGSRLRRLFTGSWMQRCSCWCADEMAQSLGASLLLWGLWSRAVRAGGGAGSETYMAGGSTPILPPPHVLPRLLQPLTALHVSGRRCPWQEIFGKRLSSPRWGVNTARKLGLYGRCCGQRSLAGYSP